MTFAFLVLIYGLPSGVRTIEATPCEVVDVKLSVGQSTLLQFDDEPSLTFHADDQHFILKSNESAKRSVVIIPNIKDQEVQRLFSVESERSFPGGQALAEALDRVYRTNLFVFFKGSTRLMFRLRFVEKNQADYVLRVKQIFQKGCSL